MIFLNTLPSTILTEKKHDNFNTLQIRGDR